jgi:GntR family transcriptional regulator
MIEIDPSSPIPRYLQIVQQVRRLIALGALRTGERLPTVRELAVLARVNRNTAARAVQQLETDGLVRTRVGQGTFVRAGELPVDRASRDESIDDLIDRLLVEAHTLGMPLEELGWRLSRRIDRFRRRRERESARHEQRSAPEDRR